MRGEARPVLARKVRLRFDRHAGTLLLLYPERGMALNATAGAILALCTGARTVDQIVDQVARSTDPKQRSIVGEDVQAFLSALATRGLVTSE